ncbi:hypothetical protein CO172_01355 [Candidatus Uhrbacteria bacterium CG_4_9_14_3_um_filter_36_7]|uniref:Thioredoxin domain-containing protein n=1 Tax=Candidatus Uhrbacteria bacterium CG_4_9_14_3_um_filter_36_7 TaxID=1975033 RepID=A0A2M7XIB1_9BACT|nr:MAG: hypothetical protein CO172_01355 [Candidatus Uhrbacteria bacterium CG_4_9_14_3_um_filter_36_7]
MKVLKFGALWCPLCPIMKPRWAEIEEARPWLKNEMYDFDQNADVAKKWGVDKDAQDKTKGLPTFIFLDKECKEFMRLHGERSIDELSKIVDENKDR